MDLEDYRIADCDFKGVIEKVEKKDHRFIKGPIPLPWIKKACELPNNVINFSRLVCNSSKSFFFFYDSADNFVQA